MDHQPGPSPEQPELASVTDINEARAERQTPVEAAKARLDQLAAEHGLTRAADGIHISLDLIHGVGGGRVDAELFREIGRAEEAYDEAAKANEPAVEGPEAPPATGEHSS